MPFKKAFGRAALPVAGASVIAIAAAIGYVMYVAAPRDAETEAETPPPAVAEAKTEVPKVVPPTPSAPVVETADPSEPAAVLSDTMPSAEVTSVEKQILSEAAPKAIPEAAPAQQPVTVETSVETQTVQNTASEADPDLTTSTAPIDAVPALSPPSVDIVRIPPEGSSIVAGRADADVDILIFVDGAEVTRAKADMHGDYVALFDIPALDRPREMQIAAERDDARVFANSSIVIAPFKSVLEPKPVELAQAKDATNAELVKTDATIQAMPADETGSTVSNEAPVAPTVMVADDTGVKILQSAATLTGVSIDAITYDPNGAVFASGRGVAGMTVRLYLDNSALMDTPVGADGQWRAKMDVAAGIYSLRADMVDGSGKVLSRVEIPFKREDVAALERLAQRTEQSDQEAVDQTVSIESAGQEGSQMNSDIEMETDPQNAPAPRISSVTVQPGNTLWGIASETYGDGFLFARVFNANVSQIRDPDLIYPGQVFILPDE